MLKLPSVQPEPSACRTLIDFDRNLGTVKAPLQFHLSASGTFFPAAGIHPHVGIARHVNQSFAHVFLGLIHLLQFEGIEPDSTAASTADVDA